MAARAPRSSRNTASKRPMNELDQSRSHRPTNDTPSLTGHNGQAVADHIRQGEYQCHGYFDLHQQNRINIYQTVDSWRSYREDNASLHTAFSSLATQQSHYGPTVPFQNYMYPQAYNPQLLPHHAPQQPVRSVYARAGYSSYRIDKSHRPSRYPSSTSRYNFRNLQPSQIASFGTLAPDVPIPSIEARTVNPLPTHQFLPPRFSGHRSYSRSPAPAPPPQPTKKYLQLAAKNPATNSSSKKLLVILDLNGTLLVRPNRRADPKMFVLRPGVDRLLRYLFDNHLVMVYSSARPENVQAIVSKLFSPEQRAQIVAVWGRDKLDLTPHQYNNKVQVYKKLDKIWCENSIQDRAPRGHRWNSTNTILVDDSHLKALAQPHNLLQLTEFENNAPREGGQALRDWQMEQERIMESLELRLEHLKWQVDVSRLIRQWQNGQVPAPGVVDETVDQKTRQAIQVPQPAGSPTPSVGQPRDTVSDTSEHQTHYPTPPSQDMGQISENSGNRINASNLDITTGLEGATISDHACRQTESPIGEEVFQELLAGPKDKSKKARSKRARRPKKQKNVDVPPTPESAEG